MHVLSQSTFLHALGWSLLNSLWQLGLLWLIYRLMLGFWPRMRPRQRHSLALVIFQSGTLWFVIDLIWNFLWPLNGLEGYVRQIFAQGGLAQHTRILSITGQALPLLSLLYLLCIAYLLIQMYRQVRFTHQISVSGKQKLRGELALFIRTWSARMGIRNEVSAWISDIVDTPLTIGFWKPVILLPVALLNNLTLRQAETVILHELQHIRRNDYLINIFISLSEIILFFNPFARLFAARIRRDRELSCDDVVLDFPYEPADYAGALLILEKSRRQNPVFAIPATGKDPQVLLNRVRRILQQPPLRRPPNIGFNLALLLSLLLGLFGFLASHVSAPGYVSSKPTPFSNASIRHLDTIGGTVESQEKTTPPAGPGHHTKPGLLASRNGSQFSDAPEREMNTVSEDVAKPSVAPINTIVRYTAPSPLVMFASGSETPIFTLRESRRSLSIPGSIGQPYVPSGSFNTSYPPADLELVWQKDHLALEMQIALKTASLLRMIAAEENQQVKELELAKLSAILQSSVAEQDWPLIKSLIQSRLQFVSAAEYRSSQENPDQFVGPDSAENSQACSSSVIVEIQDYPVHKPVSSPEAGRNKTDTGKVSPPACVIRKIVIL